MSDFNSKIKTRETRSGKIRTDINRDYESPVNFSAATRPESNSTSVYINSGTSTMRLTGREARSLYRLLQRHYQALGKTW